MSLKEQILARFQYPKKAVEVPEWGVTVYLRTLRAKETDALAKRYGGGLPNAVLVALAVVDEKGDPLFTAEELADAPAGTLAWLVGQIGEHNRGGEAEDARKN